MRYVLFGITGLYGLLSIIAAGSQVRTVRKKDTALWMLSGGALLLAAIAVSWMGRSWDWIVAAGGGSMILVAAWANGKRGGHIHYLHHAVRLAVTALLVAGFVWL